jgi:hypothetical protein
MPAATAEDPFLTARAKFSELQTMVRGIRAEIAEIEAAAEKVRAEEHRALNVAAEDLIAGRDHSFVAGEDRLRQLKREEPVASRAAERARQQFEDLGRKRHREKLEVMRERHLLAVQNVAAALVALEAANDAELSLHEELHAFGMENVPHRSLALPFLHAGSFPGLGRRSDSGSAISCWFQHAHRLGLLGGEHQ